MRDFCERVEVPLATVLRRPVGLRRSSMPEKYLFTDNYYPCASKLLSSATAQHLLEDTADDVQTAEERQAAKSPNQTQKLQPPATSQEVASQEEATTSEWQRSQDAKLAAKQAKGKLTKLVRSTGDDLIISKGLTPEAERARES